MPNIQTYENPIDGLRPSEAGVDAWRSAGSSIAESYARGARSLSQAGYAIERGASALGSGLDAFQKSQQAHQGQQEISTGGAASATMFNNLSQQWNGQDHTDPNATSKFMQGTIEPQLEQFQSGFKTPAGQKWAATQANEIRKHFITRGIADQSIAAGAQVVNNLKLMSNQGVASIDADYTTADHVIQSYQTAVKSMVDENGEMDAAAKAKVTTDLQKAASTMAEHAVVAAAAKDPAAAQALAKRYGGMGLVDVQEADKAIQTVVKAKTAADTAAQKQQLQQQKTAYNAAGNALLTDIITKGPDGSTTPTMLKVLQMPGSTPQENMSLSRYVQAAQKGIPLHLNGNAYQDMANRVHDNTNPLTRSQVLDGMTAGQISSEQGNMLIKDITVPKDSTAAANTKLINEAITNMKPVVLNGLTAGTSSYAAGVNRFSQFSLDFRQAVDAGVRAGKPISSLLNPNSPDYVAKNVRAYMIDPKTAIQLDAKGNPLAPPVPAAEGLGGQPKPAYKPGMSMDDLAKSLGIGAP